MKKNVLIEMMEGHIKVNSEDLNYSTATEEFLNCDVFGDFTKFSVNAKKLLDNISIIDCSHVTIKLHGTNKAIVIVPSEQPKDEKFLTILMPMKI